MKLTTTIGVFLKRGLPVILGLVVLVAVIAVLAGFFTSKIQPGLNEAVRIEAEIPLGTYVVQAIDKQYIEEAIGTLKSASRTDISARVNAQIVRLAVTLGETVNAGDVLIELDRAAAERQLSQAEASLGGAEAAMIQARADHQRAVRLQEASPNVITEAAFDSIVGRMGVAEANRTRAEEAVAEATVRLGYTVITAPKQGMIAQRLAEEGDMVLPGIPLLVLYDPTSLRLEVPVMESRAGQIRLGDELEVDIDALGRRYLAVVDEKVPQAEAASRSFLIKVKLPPSAELFEGMSGRLRIPAEVRRHLCLHVGAIQRIGQLEFVEVVDPTDRTRTERRFIKTGRLGNENHLEVLSGLAEGEEVVLRCPPGVDCTWNTEQGGAGHDE